MASRADPAIVGWHRLTAQHGHRTPSESSRLLGGFPADRTPRKCEGISVERLPCALASSHACRTASIDEGVESLSSFGIVPMTASRTSATCEPQCLWRRPDVQRFVPGSPAVECHVAIHHARHVAAIAEELHDFLAKTAQSAPKRIKRLDLERRLADELIPAILEVAPAGQTLITSVLPEEFSGG